jgi:hypothetical protein
MREKLDLIQMICKVRRCGVFASGIVLSRNRKAMSGRQLVKNLLVGSYRSFTPVGPIRFRNRMISKSDGDLSWTALQICLLPVIAASLPLGRNVQSV